MGALGEWLTTQEAAELSGYNVQHIRKLVRDNRIEGKKWRRDWMVNRISLVNYLENEGYGPQVHKKLDKV